MLALIMLFCVVLAEQPAFANDNRTSCSGRCETSVPLRRCSCHRSCMNAAASNCCGDYQEFCAAAHELGNGSSPASLAANGSTAGKKEKRKKERERAHEDSGRRLGLSEACGRRGTQGVKEKKLYIGGFHRKYLYYIPEHSSDEHGLPVWLVAGGTDDTAAGFLKYIGLNAFAEEKRFAFFVLQAHKKAGIRKFNVGLGSRADPEGIDDFGYAQNIVQEILGLPCLDRRQVHCTGYSNGGRFCAQLASEMSDVIASISLVSSLRYPKPNNATRAMPVLAFHGTDDTVNPWSGDGNAKYWNESLMDAFHEWGRFNGCKNLQKAGATTFVRRELVHHEGRTIFENDSFSLAQCENACAANSSCNSFTWSGGPHSSDTATCALKDKVVTAETPRLPGWVSYYPVGSQYVRRPLVADEGNTTFSKVGGSLAQCKNACAEDHSLCKSFSWNGGPNSDDTATCVLKTKNVTADSAHASGWPTEWTSYYPAQAEWQSFGHHFRVITLRDHCRDGANVELLKIIGGGHTWPGCAEDKPDAWLGSCNKDISANELTWAFFQRHPLPSSTTTILSTTISTLLTTTTFPSTTMLKGADVEDENENPAALAVARPMLFTTAVPQVQTTGLPEAPGLPQAALVPFPFLPSIQVYSQLKLWLFRGAAVVLPVALTCLCVLLRNRGSACDGVLSRQQDEPTTFVYTGEDRQLLSL